jgi:thiamine transport system permease protein
LISLFFSWLFSLIFIYFKPRFLTPIVQLFWVLPGFAYALITLFLLRSIGVEHRYSMFSVTIAWIMAGTPYLILAFENVIQDLDFRQKEAMQTLGASPLKSFYHFEFSNTLHAQGFALLQQFWLYLTSFSLVMILSGGFPNETLEVAIYTSVRLDHVDLNHALALGIWQMLLLIPIRILLTRLQKLTRVSEWSRPTLKEPSRMRGLIFTSLLIFGIFFYASCRGLETEGMFVSLETSVLLASFVTVITLSWVSALHAFKLHVLAEIGAWVSPMLLTLLWWRQFGFTIVPLANALIIQIILFAPWMARILYPVLKRARILELEAAQTLGCTPFQAWIRVEWPRIRKTVYFTAAMVFVLSCTEVTSVILFAQNEFQPLSVWVQNSFMRFRMDEAILGTCVLVAICYLSLNTGRGET